MEVQLQLQLPPPNHPRVPSACDRHPDQPVTGFCASCLRERLAGLETDRKPFSSSTLNLKSIFFKVSAAFEAQRKSCDVRGRNTLWSLFHQADMNRFLGVPDSSSSSSAAIAPTGDIEIEIESSVAVPVLEAREEEESEDMEDEIRPADPVLAVIDTSREIMEEEEEEEVTELKTMKHHIDLESQDKKPHPLPHPHPHPHPPKESKETTGGGSFWLAASVFSKKLQNWRRKQKLKKQRNNAAASAIQPDKTHKSSHRFRETQSEIAVDAFGRRSCDIDPRFSLDAGRMSIDDPRLSWDAPRASWDGHLIGVRSVIPRLPPMLAVAEDAHIPAVERWDGRIPVEEDAIVPGGTAQTQDYYLDSSSSSSRRRRSLERSNSVRKSVDSIEPFLVPNAKVTPAGGMDFFNLSNGFKLDRDSRDFSSNSLRDDRSESFESTFRDHHNGAPKKKSRRWSKAWNIWGLIYRRGSSRGGGAAANGVERSFSETWPELREQVYNGKIFRSNSNVSMRASSISNNSGFGSMRRSNVETNGHGHGHGKKRRGQFVLERSRSARYSPGHVDNGLLRFYLTPMRSSRRNGLPEKSRHNNACSVTRTVLGMY